jgi:hypothetical protein
MSCQARFFNTPSISREPGIDNGFISCYAYPHMVPNTQIEPDITPTVLNLLLQEVSCHFCKAKSASSRTRS